MLPGQLGTVRAQPCMHVHESFQTNKNYEKFRNNEEEEETIL